MARKVTATTTRSREVAEEVLEHEDGRLAQGGPDDGGALLERDEAGHDLRRRRRRRHEPQGRRRGRRGGWPASSGGPSSGRAAGVGRGGGRPGLAPEDLPAALEAAPQVAPGVAEAAVQEEALAQGLLRVRALLDRDGDQRLARQDGPALDEDELAGHGHEGADVRHLLGVEVGQRLEVGAGEVAQGAPPGCPARAAR